MGSLMYHGGLVRGRKEMNGIRFWGIATLVLPSLLEVQVQLLSQFFCLCMPLPFIGRVVSAYGYALSFKVVNGRFRGAIRHNGSGHFIEMDGSLWLSLKVFDRQSLYFLDDGISPFLHPSDVLKVVFPAKGTE